MIRPPIKMRQPTEGFGSLLKDAFTRHAGTPVHTVGTGRHCTINCRITLCFDEFNVAVTLRL